MPNKTHSSDIDGSNDNKSSRSVLRWCTTTSLKFLLAMVFGLGLYSIYLDGKIRKTFEGQRWQVPVQVYGKVEQFKKSDQLNLSQLADSLLFSGYKKVSFISLPGEFSLSTNRIIIFRRVFNYGAEMAEPVKITIDVMEGHVEKLFYGNDPVDQIQLEPILIDRIVPESKEDRVLVSLETVPEKLLDTLLLVEDREFYFHSGVSPLGILRAFYNNLRAGRTVQGGSTLTQQLVKNMFLTRNKTLWRKANEAIMALILEYRYSKDQLLETYINEVYLGQNDANGVYGFGLAAEFYFGQAIEHLNAEQIAMLVGQVKGPSYYDPWRYPQHAIARRDLVLKLMFQNNLLSKVEFEHAIESSLSVRKERRLVKQKYPAYMQLIKRELTQHLSKYDQQSGIRVFTGFSHYSQTLLEQTVAEQLPLLEENKSINKLETSMIVTDIATGEVRALVGGKENGYAGFNRALNAKRPIGSLIKPIIYLAALERYEQYNLASIIEDKAITLTSDSGKLWSPKNYDSKYRGQVNFIEALVNSLNIPTINLGMKLGLNNIVNVLHLLGYQENITIRPSLLLGSVNMSPIEVNQLYLAIAAKGHVRQGHGMTKIVSEQGETLWQFIPRDEQLFSSQASYLIDYALTEVAKRGTARSLSWRLKGNNIAGKTGTTNEDRDSWFVGYDGQTLITTWLGRDDNLSTKHTGSSGALILFSQYISKLGVVDKSFSVPQGISLVRFEKQSGNAVNDECADIIELPAITASLNFISNCLQPAKKKRSWLEKLFGK